MFEIAVIMVVAFAAVLVIMPFLIPLLRRMKFGQQILEEGPVWHKKKQGTPTMGGIGFIIAILIASAVFVRDVRALLVLGFAFVCGVVGFVDDYIKVVMKRNMGFNPKQKTACLLVGVLLFMALSQYMGYTDTKIYIPFFKVYANLWYFYYPLIVLAVFGAVNSVNLTDGIDGLAASVTVVVSLFFAVLSFVCGYKGLTTLSAAVAGGLIGFLVFNLHPAKVFMGDTGSLFLGGFVAATAVIMKNPLMLLMCGFVYVAESLSVILQVASFKLTGKRIFKMSPIHHHFEKCGWSENEIVFVFCFVTILMSVLAYMGV